MDASAPPTHYRTIWISDVHLGTKGCKADFLLDFLRHTESDTLYLVGDIVDGWRLRKSWYWPQSHNDIVQKLLRKGRKGTRLVFLPGNHDEFARQYVENNFGGIEVLPETVHATADGRRLLVMHGDRFDGVVKYARWLALLGDTAYGAALAINHWVNVVRRRLGRPYWSLSQYLKNRVKNALQFMLDFEHACLDEARRRELDGVVCGHIHQAALKQTGGLTYANDGDWVESCTALVEHADGRLEIINWAETQAFDFFTALARPDDTPADGPGQLPEKETACASSSSRMPGSRRSTAWFARWTRSATSWNAGATRSG